MKQAKRQDTAILLRDKPEQGVEIMYERYGKRLYSYGISSWKLNEDDCWDMVYQTLYKVVEKSGSYTFENEKKFSSFIFTVFCNFLRRNYRDTNRISEHMSFTNFSESLLEDARFDPRLGTERQVIRQIREESLRNHEEDHDAENPLMKYLEEALDQLEDWQRILLLQRSLDRPYSEIAEFVGKPVEQLKVYYQRAKTKLESLLAEKMEMIKLKQD